MTADASKEDEKAQLKTDFADGFCAWAGVVIVHGKRECNAGADSARDNRDCRSE